MDAFIDEDVCEDCGVTITDTPDWVVDIVLCKMCYRLRKETEIDE
jgi:hypothetical protein